MSLAAIGFAAAAEAAADEAGAVIRRYFRASIDVDVKEDQSPVTLADRGAEAAIRAVLAAHYPTHGLVGEELGGTRQGRFTWLIDPIDGTRAFITGRASFATLIALMDEETPILGLIDQPITGERWLAYSGKLQFTGAFGGRPRCRSLDALAQAELSCTSPDMFDAAQNQRFRGLAGSCRRVTYGGDAYAYGLLALGQIDVIAESGLKPWDWAALVPVVEAAGGTITDWAGAPLSLTGDGSVLAVGDPALLAACVSSLVA
ncbi:MAG TPA: inositol monophosphatase family protein [Acidiphilium sp.]|nr:MAG: histidinol phosphate phosphatase [Acidiphilium sp. 21-60-14]OYV90336.1 MAG: histidinol phosphate phosphatase [Acidiphilium sp. 37-60-79]OZB41562.1 MAG: histidinol phosphate phosphatase [Acidiphilium sp. 34-60-192]HQT88979.1 inositol monophosphatase family protein [Acidiphilium sp.]HQU23996.1 inositol monophosphatase family protein [Acidiphilium sp.]